MNELYSQWSPSFRIPTTADRLLAMRPEGHPQRAKLKPLWLPRKACRRAILDGFLVAFDGGPVLALVGRRWEGYVVRECDEAVAVNEFGVDAAVLGAVDGGGDVVTGARAVGGVGRVGDVDAIADGGADSVFVEGEADEPFFRPEAESVADEAEQIGGVLDGQRILD